MTDALSPIVDPIVFIAAVSSLDPHAALTEIDKALTPIAVTTSMSDGISVATFHGGSATLRAVDKTLLIEVEACDMVTCHGIKATIGGLLASIVSDPPPDLLWVPKEQMQD